MATQIETLAVALAGDITREFRDAAVARSLLTLIPTAATPTPADIDAVAWCLNSRRDSTPPVERSFESVTQRLIELAGSTA